MNEPARPRGKDLGIGLLTATALGLWLQATGYPLLGTAVVVIVMAAGFRILWRRRVSG